MSRSGRNNPIPPAAFFSHPHVVEPIPVHSQPGSTQPQPPLLMTSSVLASAFQRCPRCGYARKWTRCEWITNVHRMSPRVQRKHLASRLATGKEGSFQACGFPLRYTPRNLGGSPCGGSSTDRLHWVEVGSLESVPRSSITDSQLPCANSRFVSQTIGG
jgi:hypothetical protein